MTLGMEGGGILGGILLPPEPNTGGGMLVLPLGIVGGGGGTPGGGIPGGGGGSPGGTPGGGPNPGGACPSNPLPPLRGGGGPLNLLVLPANPCIIPHLPVTLSNVGKQQILRLLHILSNT